MYFIGKILWAVVVIAVIVVAVVLVGVMVYGTIIPDSGVLVVAISWGMIYMGLCIATIGGTYCCLSVLFYTNRASFIAELVPIGVVISGLGGAVLLLRSVGVL